MRKMGRVLVIVGLAVILLKARLYFNKPNYDEVYLLPKVVLDLSEAVFSYQLSRGFSDTPIPARSFYLQVLEGYPERSFYERFNRNSFPPVERNWLKSKGQHERDASLSIDKIVNNQEYISVIATIEYCYDKIDNIEYITKKDGSKWAVEQSYYSTENLSQIISANKEFQRNNLRCASIIR
ncbi:MAG: hypothetical protein MI756_18600 [Chromatiales bacterium]|nr:hypothetical protein [Chromatiales bacterium]